MGNRFIIWVNLHEDGDVRNLSAMDNDTLESVPIYELNQAPEFIVERIALIKLTDVNKSEKGELVGRKLSPNVIIIYLTYDEYQQIKEECK